MNENNNIISLSEDEASEAPEHHRAITSKSEEETGQMSL